MIIVFSAIDYLIVHEEMKLSLTIIRKEAEFVDLIWS